MFCPQKYYILLLYKKPIKSVFNLTLSESIKIKYILKLQAKKFQTKTFTTGTMEKNPKKIKRKKKRKRDLRDSNKIIAKSNICFSKIYLSFAYRGILGYI